MPRRGLPFNYEGLQLLNRMHIKHYHIIELSNYHIRGHSVDQTR